jgi:hypothetical protein
MIRKAALTCVAAALPLLSYASSHREAPDIAGSPRLDGTDLYMFRSYEPGRDGYVTLIANYIPFQGPFGGPNFYQMDPNAIYAINIDNKGNALADISFQFQFQNQPRNLTVPAGNLDVAVPLLNIGPITAADNSALNVVESYTLTVRGGGRGKGQPAGNATLGGTTFYKPVDNIGQKSIADYSSYADSFIYDVNIPGCDMPGRVFVGQRKDPFFVNLGEIFDLVNLNPVGPRDGAHNSLTHYNVTEIALEVPIKCLTSGKDPVIGAWTTASIRKDRNGDNNETGDDGDESYMQKSRLGAPLINEVIIGLPDKDTWNYSKPKDDAQFLKYVTNPSLPVLLNVLFGGAANVPGTPRNDLVAAFLTGVPGLNQPLHVRPAELLRLNTSIAPTPPASQNDLGVLGGDVAGFPNGRRPYDDVVDIELRVAEGALCGAIGNCGADNSDPNHGFPYTDQVEAAGPDAADLHTSGAEDPTDTFLAHFPYLNYPLPGSPNGPNGIPAP